MDSREVDSGRLVGSQRGGFWEVGRTFGLVSPLDPSRILPVGGRLLVPLSSPGPPV